MGIISKGFERKQRRYVLQGALATATILGIFFLLDVLLRSTLVSSLGASTFIAFAMPHSRQARSRALVGGYMVGTLCGTLCSLAADCALAASTGLNPRTRLIIFGALAIGLAILIMLVTDTGHPPAAGLALGFVADPWTETTVLFVLSAISLLALTRYFLRHVLIDLV
ncbi:MAG: HPP family protein [Anaerolineales bacterium]